jgi:hypothetical protein
MKQTEAKNARLEILAWRGKRSDHEKKTWQKTPKKLAVSQQYRF